MKRLVLVAVVALALAVGFMLVGTGDTQSPTPAGGGGGGGSWGHHHAVDVSVNRAVPTASGWVYRGSTITCAVKIGWGVVGIGGYIFGDGITWPALSLASGDYSIWDAQYNKDCAADSFYNHIGERELCYQRHFMYWADNGQPVLDGRDGICDNKPSGLDAVYCNYLYASGCGGGGGGGGSW